MIWLLLLGADVPSRPPWDVLRPGMDRPQVIQALRDAGHREVSPTTRKGERGLIVLDGETHFNLSFSSEDQILERMGWFSRGRRDIAAMCAERMALRRSFGQERVERSTLERTLRQPGYFVSGPTSSLRIGLEADGTWSSREHHESGDDAWDWSTATPASGATGWAGLEWGMSLADAEAALWLAGYDVLHYPDPYTRCGVPNAPILGVCGFGIMIEFRGPSESGFVAGHMLRGISRYDLERTGLPDERAARRREPALRDLLGPPDKTVDVTDLRYPDGPVDASLTTWADRNDGTWKWYGALDFR